MFPNEDLMKNEDDFCVLLLFVILVQGPACEGPSTFLSLSGDTRALHPVILCLKPDTCTHTLIHGDSDEN